MTDGETIGIYVPSHIAEWLRKQATEENRSLSRYIYLSVILPWWEKNENAETRAENQENH